MEWNLQRCITTDDGKYVDQKKVLWTNEQK